MGSVTVRDCRGLVVRAPPGGAAGLGPTPITLQSGSLEGGRDCGLWPRLWPRGAAPGLLRDPAPRVCPNRSRFLTQNLFGKMADILEKIKK